MGKLEGKIALITGGNGGIGLATAKQFVNEDAYVFITGRREQELAAAVKEIGRNVTGVQGDVNQWTCRRKKAGVALTSLQNSNTINFCESLLSDKYFVALF